jgi:phosphorylcholine metabolism protein LicD
MKVEDFVLPKSYYKKLYTIATVVNNILSKNNIQYFCQAGTLIGVLRHKGIIPWDDDIDIRVWHRDWLNILKTDIREQFEEKGYSVVKETGINLIKVFKTDSKEGRKNYKFPCLDIFSISLDKKDRNKIVNTHKWARDLWPNDYQILDNIYPLKYLKFGGSKIIVPNDSVEYLNRLYGTSWKTEGRIYQSHVLGVELEKPIIYKGPFVPAKNFDNTKLIMASDKILKNYPSYLKIRL